MNATMTCNDVVFKPDHAGTHSILSALRRFFNALLETNRETPYGLPTDMAVRLYL